ncbi:unnamed protein product [Amoebophrya sp. A25]|nr:unnamed protein product [Amoebophrya sp. A25]|eukprot:GSA25T00003934001.1
MCARVTEAAGEEVVGPASMPEDEQIEDEDVPLVDEGEEKVDIVEDDPEPPPPDDVAVEDEEAYVQNEEEDEDQAPPSPVDDYDPDPDTVKIDPEELDVVDFYLQTKRDEDHKLRRGKAANPAPPRLPTRQSVQYQVHMRTLRRRQQGEKAGFVSFSPRFEEGDAATPATFQEPPEAREEYRHIIGDSTRFRKRASKAQDWANARKSAFAAAARRRLNITMKKLEMAPLGGGEPTGDHTPRSVDKENKQRNVDNVVYNGDFTSFKTTNTFASERSECEYSRVAHSATSGSSRKHFLPRSAPPTRTRSPEIGFGSSFSSRRNVEALAFASSLLPDFKPLGRNLGGGLRAGVDKPKMFK